jgi:hypothetical protein
MALARLYVVFGFPFDAIRSKVCSLSVFFAALLRFDPGDFPFGVAKGDASVTESPASGLLRGAALTSSSVSLGEALESLALGCNGANRSSLFKPTFRRLLGWAIVVLPQVLPQLVALTQIKSSKVNLKFLS